MKKLLSVLLLVFILGCNKEGKVGVSVINYKGWGNSVEITNSQIRLVVVPQIGRIMSLGFVAEENILFENESLLGKRVSGLFNEGEEITPPPFGGDRIWPTSQELFEEINGSRFIADPWIDGSEWDYGIIPNGVRVESPVSENCGVKVIREITLLQGKPSVAITQKMVKVKLSKQAHLEPIPVTIWNLTQLKPTTQTFIQLNENSLFKDQIFIPQWPDAENFATHNYFSEDGYGVLIPDKKMTQKIGADSPGWIAGVVGNTLLVEEFDLNKSMKYPDGGTSSTIFTAPTFTELECLSPEVELEVGESINHFMAWHMFKLSEKNSSLKEQREEAVKLISNLKK